MKELDLLLLNRLKKETTLAPSAEETLKKLIEVTRKGDLCLRIDDSSVIPAFLYEHGVDDDPFPLKPLVIQANRLYLQRNWAIETLLLQTFSLFLREEKELYEETIFEELFSKTKNNLQTSQAAAIQKAFHQKLSIFTGGPGTGKTFTASCLIHLLHASYKKEGRFKVAIAAPTGKAAAHLESVLKKQGSLPPNLHVESTTLHSLLKLSPSKEQFHRKETIDAHLIVVDEASMLDVSLMLHLFQRVGPQSRLLLLGDPHQLPPIEGGSLFSAMGDLVGSELKISMRTANLELTTLAEAIKKGDRIKISPEQIPSGRKQLTALLSNELLSPLHSQKPDPALCLQNQKKSKILSPLRQGPYGVDQLNQDLLAYFEERRKKGDWMAIPIVITQNAPKQKLYNGTSGVLIGSFAYFLLGEEICSFPEAGLPNYEMAFCLSVHKSQGSEFEEVLALFPPGSELFGKEALYTAVTRAKQKARLLCEDETLGLILQKSSKTISGFQERAALNNY